MKRSGWHDSPCTHACASRPPHPPTQPPPAPAASAPPPSSSSRSAPTASSPRCSPTCCATSRWMPCPALCGRAWRRPVGGCAHLLPRRPSKLGISSRSLDAAFSPCPGVPGGFRSWAPSHNHIAWIVPEYSSGHIQPHTHTCALGAHNPAPPCPAAFMLVRLSFLVSLLASFPLHMHPFRQAARQGLSHGRAQGGWAARYVGWWAWGFRGGLPRLGSSHCLHFVYSMHSGRWAPLRTLVAPRPTPALQGQPVDAALPPDAAGAWLLAGELGAAACAVLAAADAFRGRNLGHSGWKCG